MALDFDVRRGRAFFIIMNYELIIQARSDSLKLKHLNDGFIFCSFSLLKMLIDWLSCGLLVDYCDAFISCVDSHSDAKFLQICSDE